MLPIEADWFDEFTPSATPAGALIEEEGDVGAELAGPVSESVQGHFRARELIECEKGVGCVGASSSEAGAVGDIFGEVYPEITGGFGLFFEEAKCLGDEVALVSGDAGGVAVKRVAF